MKKIKSILLLLTCFLLLTGFSPSPINSSTNAMNMSDEDVIKQLDEYKNELMTEYNMTSDSERKLTLTEHISSIEQLSNTYKNSVKNSQISARNTPDILIPDPLAAHRLNVAAVLAFFRANGYRLAAELLTHASANKTLNSYYVPSQSNTSQIRNTSFYKQKTALNIFETGSNRFDSANSNMDLYYAIHRFNYEVRPGYPSWTLTITDRYDFDLESYGSIAGIAVNLMVLAQTVGVLTPYVVYIPLSYNK